MKMSRSLLIPKFSTDSRTPSCRACLQWLWLLLAMLSGISELTPAYAAALAGSQYRITALTVQSGQAYFVELDSNQVSHFKNVPLTGGSINQLGSIAAAYLEGNGEGIAEIFADASSLYGGIGSYLDFHVFKIPSSGTNNPITWLMGGTPDNNIDQAAFAGVGSTDVFLMRGWNDGYGGGIKRISKTGGSVQYVSGTGWLRSHDQNSTHLFWQDYYSRDVFRTELIPSGATQIVIDQAGWYTDPVETRPPEFGFSVDSTQLYRVQSGVLNRYDFSGTLLTPLVSAGASGVITSDDTWVYFYDTNFNGISRVPKLGGVIQTLLSISAVDLGQYAVTSDRLIWVDKSLGLGQITLNSSTFEELLTPIPEPASLSLLAVGSMLMLCRRK